ncbi:precorrin-3B C(17)-methyltransferase, partial [Paenibacillus polymyxa]|uniref:precorrin-3B C(17)-methyltransferase n=1 Tax=Paenibacillus polymyxa TaxID=1406 RepID=UPI0004715C67
MSPLGKLLVIGFGPGDMEHITKRALDALAESEVIIGYNTYVDLIRPLLNGQEIVRTGMTEEVSRAQEAVRQAEMGKKVAVISSGDAGVYGMAGLVYEVLMQKGWRREDGVEVEVVPGISAIQSCASLLGAPVMHDACTISLSDHLTPWETIVKRVEAAASADFVIALYNPRSGRRTRQIVETQSILLRYRDPQTPVGLVKSAYRERQQVIVTTLEDMLNHDIGMLTTVIIGNSSTTVYDGLIVTPRGYQRKYTLDATEQVLKPHQRLRTEAEPWSLGAQEDRALDAPQGGGALTAPTGPSASGAAVATQARPQAMAAVQVPPAKQTGATPASLAAEALGRLAVGGKLPGEANARWSGQAPTAQSAVGTATTAAAGGG